MSIRNEMIRKLFEKFGSDKFFITENTEAWFKIGIYYMYPNASYIDFYIHNDEIWDQVNKRLDRHLSSLKEESCVICDESYDDDKKLLKINCAYCGHHYCSDCYVNILRSNFNFPKCPFCNHGVYDEPYDYEFCTCEIERRIISHCNKNECRYPPPPPSPPTDS